MTKSDFFFTFKKLFIFVSAGSSLLWGQWSCPGCGASFSLQWPLLLQITGFRVRTLVSAACGPSCGSWALEYRLSSCGTWAQLLHSMWESSWIRDWTGVSCIGRWILYHWATTKSELRGTLRHWRESWRFSFFTLDTKFIHLFDQHLILSSSWHAAYTKE